MSDETPKIVPMTPKPSEMAIAGEQLRRTKDEYVKNTQVVAELRRASYLAYLAAGFDEKQALELCTK